ncbi:unnamed protein product [Trichogramma brassicae]|uniref:Uncharacterized protein n=1 Tax=Trichogramma brassicae TaxID=86971 RepID=A0A6H5I174_9HYME|nr:unnamed protein product [Trichogramma brassicae]
MGQAPTRNYATRMMNTAVQSSTRVSPAFLNYGRHPRPVKSLRREVEPRPSNTGKSTKPCGSTVFRDSMRFAKPRETSPGQGARETSSENRVCVTVRFSRRTQPSTYQRRHYRRSVPAPVYGSAADRRDPMRAAFCVAPATRWSTRAVPGPRVRVSV